MKNYRRITANVSSEALRPVGTYEHHTGFTKASAPRPTRKIRLFPSKPLKIAALASVSLMGVATASTISIDFHGTTQSVVLGPADVAGEVPAPLWNPAFGNINTSGISVDAVSLPGAATVAWTSSGSMNTPANSLSTPDHQMMEGYIYGMIGTSGPSPAQVRVSSIDLSGLGWGAYDVYVYSDTSLNGATVQVDLLGGVSYAHTEIPGPFYNTGAFPGYFDSQIVGSGNYVKFSGLTANNFTIEATPLPGIDIAAINGIQIVESSVPEPSAVLLSFLGVCSLALRRKRTA